MKKLVLGLVAVVAVLVVGAVGYLYVNLNGLIKQGVEEFAPQYTKTAVSLGGASVSIFSGEGGLSNLVIGNPAGYKGKEAMRLGNLGVAVDTGSLTSDTIVIKSLSIVGPAISYEPGGKAGSNLQQLVKNIEQASQSSASSDSSATAGGSGSEKKVIIDRLTIRDGRVEVITPLSEQPLKADLPTIELTGIGRKQGGASASSVLKQVMEKVTASASQVAGVSLDDLKAQAGAKAKEKIQEAVGDLKGSAGDKIKGLFGR